MTLLWPLETHGYVNAPSGAKDWYKNNPAYVLQSHDNAKLVTPHMFKLLLEGARDINENTIYRSDEPGKDFWGNESVRRVWTVSGWRSIFYGDCDDTATRKLKYAMDIGFKRTQVKLCYCKKLGVKHLVLLALDSHNRIWTFDNTNAPFRGCIQFSMDDPTFEYISVEGFDPENPTRWLSLKKKPSLWDVIKKVS